MAFHVSSDQVDRNVRALASLTGQTITDAINEAVLEKLRRVQPRKLDSTYVADLMSLSEGMARTLQPEIRTTDELIGYDEDGLPG